FEHRHGFVHPGVVECVRREDAQRLRFYVLLVPERVRSTQVRLMQFASAVAVAEVFVRPSDATSALQDEVLVAQLTEQPCRLLQSIPGARPGTLDRVEEPEQKQRVRRAPLVAECALELER